MGKGNCTVGEAPEKDHVGEPVFGACLLGGGSHAGGCDIDEVMCDMELSVTGNDNGSYYCSSSRAQAAVEGVIFDNDFHNAANCYGFCLSDYLDSPETFDVVVRIVAFNELYSDIYSMVKSAIEEVEYDD